MKKLYSLGLLIGLLVSGSAVAMNGQDDQYKTPTQGFNFVQVTETVSPSSFTNVNRNLLFEFNSCVENCPSPQKKINKKLHFKKKKPKGNNGDKGIVSFRVWQEIGKHIDEINAKVEPNFGISEPLPKTEKEKRKELSNSNVVNWKKKKKNFFFRLPQHFKFN